MATLESSSTYRGLNPPSLVVPAILLAALLVSTVVGGALGVGSFLQVFIRTAAILLLLGVARASLQTGNRWRAFIRHDSIRADIAAAGGLGQRLMV